MRWRRVLGLVVATSLTVFGAPDARAQGFDPAEIPALEERLAELVAAEGELAAEVADAESTVVRRASVLAAVDGEVRSALLELDRLDSARLGPALVRQALAVELYVEGGNTQMNAVIESIGEGTSDLARLRDRHLTEAVQQSATDEVERIDTRIAELAAWLAEDVPTRRAEARAALADAEAARDRAADELTPVSAERTEVAERIELIKRLESTLPLTGLLVEQKPTRPALAIKIDNAPPARPQVGLSRADIVFEELVEGGISRFIAVFHSQGSDTVGPIRSARTSDFHILAQLGTPLFGNSGGNPTVVRELAAATARGTLTDVGVNAVNGGYRRDGGRPVPHNLFTSTTTLWSRGRGGEVPNLFTYRPLGAPLPPSATVVDGVRISFGATTASYSWDRELGGWRRQTDGVSQTDAATGEPIAPENVVIRFTPYGISPADPSSPEAQMTGTGEAWVLTAGHLIRGRWSQSSNEEPATFVDVDGNPIGLTPGRTWIGLPRPGDARLL